MNYIVKCFARRCALKKMIFILLTLLSWAELAFASSVYFLDEQVGNDTILGMQIRIENDVGRLLRNVKIRYIFQKDREEEMVVESSHLETSKYHLSLLNDTLGYIEISMDSIPEGFYPKDSGIGVKIHYRSLRLLNKTKDPSYLKSSEFVKNPKILFYEDMHQATGQISVNMQKNISANTNSLNSDPYPWKTRNYQSDEAGFIYEEKDGVLQIDPMATILAFQGINVDLWKERPVERIRARKDTRLLNLSYMHNLKENGWDVSHVDSLKMDSKESLRCWAISAEVINHFYGGNITQDEIVFAVQFKKSEPLWSPLANYGADSVKIDKSLKFVLNSENIIRYEGTPSYQIVKREIDAGRLILVGIYQHVMVIHGYVGDESNYAFLYAFGDNEGTESNSVIKDSPIEFYYLMENAPTSVRMTDYRIHYDSDSDGLVNFDEEERFGTDPFNVDSDGDGIDDKREIYSYAYNANSPCSNCDAAYDLQYMSDKDKDGVRAEMDADDNGDGIIDGLQRFSDDTLKLMAVPVDYTLFARDHLTLNDGVQCFNSVLENESFCKIASAGGNAFQYIENPEVVSLGVDSHVGNVDAYFRSYSNGIVKMRNRSVIHGDVGLFAKSSLPEVGDVVDTVTAEKFMSRQQASEIQGQVELKYVRDWKLNYLFTLPNISKVVYSSKKEVSTGETFYFSNGMAYDTLKIDNGATLVLEPGEMFVRGLLQLEPGAVIEFSNPGVKTILNVDGKLNWKTSSNRPLEDMNYWNSVASGFMLVLHKSGTIYIEGDLCGTLYAPLAKIIIGQTKKIYYGRILAKDIVVHQRTKIFRVDFNPKENFIYVWRN